MKSRQQSVGKEAPVYTDNEDAWRTDNEAGVWAVADGAGGTGIYAGEWAQHLVQHVPEVPFQGLGGLAHWLDTVWVSFFDTYQPQAQSNYLIDRKFMGEGSSATLATLHYQADKVHWMVYGDAVAICFQPATGELWAANPDVRQFESAPYLLNWLSPPRSDGFMAGVWPHQPGQQYALLSDALGQCVLMAYAALQGDLATLRTVAQQPTALGNRAQTHLNHWTERRASFEELVWIPLQTALASPTQFLAYTQELRTQQLLGADDYTGILIND
ncbi:hypothetical protein [Spirosoma radiotolerans]|uniref:Serine/threonine protein phosphatase n=1 Tax=Spirosoma radiotolerans TaxID=1379870 RepID=A0A0E3ZXB2_9BACT|nr:hypothetical protein [Spirosoma radiotolerans]AKD56083.1 hypothetical protein SD10_15455 [Spirosoma radiotolerans]